MGGVAFTLQGLCTLRYFQILDSDGIAIRAVITGAMPLHEKLIYRTARASFYLYNTTAEVDQWLIDLQAYLFGSLSTRMIYTLN